MKLSFFLFLLFPFAVLQAQITRDYNVSFVPTEYVSNAPIWTYTVQDETNIGVPIERRSNYITNGYNMVSAFRMPSWQPVITADKLFSASVTKGTTSHNYGAIVNSIDLETGVPDWTYVFDNRTLDRQEYVERLNIVEDSLLELTIYRRVEPHTTDVAAFLNNINGDYSTLAKRFVNTATGELMEYWFNDPLDSTKLWIVPNTQGLTTLFERPDGDYNYVQNEGYRLVRGWQCTRFQENGMEVGQFFDTLYNDTDQFEVDEMLPTSLSRKMMSYGPDSIITLHALTKGDSLVADQQFLSLYDADFNLIKRTRLNAIVNAYPNVYDFYITQVEADKLFLTLELAEGQDNLVHLVIDFDGNILCSIADSTTFNSGGEWVTYLTYLPYSQTYMAVGYEIDAQYDFLTNFDLEFFIYDENGNWERVHEIQFAKNHLLRFVHSIDQLPDGDLIMGSDNMVWDPSVQEGSITTNTWTRIDGDALGLIVATVEAPVNNSSVAYSYPNPAGSGSEVSIIIDMEGLRSGVVNGTLYDSAGRNLFEDRKITMNDGLGTMLLPGELQLGLYFLELANPTTHKRTVMRIVVQ